MKETDEIVWQPDQETVYVAEFEKFFREPITLIWPHVIRDKHSYHFMYKLNRSHMHKGEIISCTDSTLEFRWDHDRESAEMISVHPMTDEEFLKVQKEYPGYKSKKDILADYIEAY